MSSKLILTSLFSLVILFSAFSKDPNDRLIGKWKITKVVEIGSWAIKTKNVTQEYDYLIKFTDKNLTVIDSENNEHYGHWELNKDSKTIYYPNASQSNYLFLRKENLATTDIRIQGWPMSFENLEIGKRKLVMYTKEKGKKTKYVLTRLD